MSIVFGGIHNVLLAIARELEKGVLYQGSVLLADFLVCIITVLLDDHCQEFGSHRVVELSKKAEKVFFGGAVHESKQYPPVDHVGLGFQGGLVVPPIEDFLHNARVIKVKTCLSYYVNIEFKSEIGREV